MKSNEQLGKDLLETEHELHRTLAELETYKEKYAKEKEQEKEQEEKVTCPICKEKGITDIEQHFKDNPECYEAYKKQAEEKALRKFAESALDAKSRIGWKDRLTKKAIADFVKKETLKQGIIPDSPTEYVDRLTKDMIAESFQLGKCPVCGLCAEEIRIREGTEFVLSKKEKQELSDFTMGIGNWIAWLQNQTPKDMKQVRDNKALSNDLIHVQIHLQAKHPKIAGIISQIFGTGKSGSGNTIADEDKHIRKESKIAEKLSAKEPLTKEERNTFFKAWRKGLRRKGDK